MTITRFAPSPTGYLHIGSVRTALYCWLWAKRTNGQFILRIEDTDRERSTQEAVDVIIQGLEWLGLTWDQGPYYQTERFDRYKEVVQQLLSTGHAYQCTCSKERLTELREAQMQNKEKPRYDGHCRDKDQGALPEGSYVVRFKNPLEGEVVIEDVIKGRIVIHNKELDDLIILRTDGTPTYNLTVVVDDWDMGITVVLRGDDHINNTPRQINIFKALNADIPEYGHMPMLLGPDSKKLSKRHGAASVLEYKEEGYLKEALINYLVRLGWSKGNQEIFSIEELIQDFDIHTIQPSAAAINPEKLLWLNQHYLKHLPADEVATRLQPFIESRGGSIASGPALTDIIPHQSERCKTLVEMADKSLFWYSDHIHQDSKDAAKHLNESCLPQLKLLVEKLEKLDSWTKENIQQCLDAVLSELGIKLGQLGPAVRIATTGGTTSPSINITLQLLGKERTLSRLIAIIEKIET